jgi:peptidoglycan hydrolase-like protein with peptidoglycan-binding domain
MAAGIWPKILSRRVPEQSFLDDDHWYMEDLVMSRYRIRESVGARSEDVHSYEDLEIHHPSANARGLRTGRDTDFERNRDHARVNGEFEEIRRTADGGVLVKKDFILEREGSSGPVNVPAPIGGYVHYLRGDPTAALRIYDKPFGETSAKLVGQVLHMDPATFRLQEGAHVRYGQPLGVMSDTGTPGSFHAHVEVDAAQFRRYVADINSGAITPETYPDMTSTEPLQTLTRAQAGTDDDVLKEGERGAKVRVLQEQLNQQGFRDTRGRSLSVDGDFGGRTGEAVRALQRARGLEADGIVGRDTTAVLLQPTPRQLPQGLERRQSDARLQSGPTALSNLIGRGEGGYNSFNRGRAGDAGSGEIDFSQMTLGEVMRRQGLSQSDPNRVFAVGKFQMIPGTLREAVNAMGLDHDQRLTPALQERMFADYLIDEKRPAVHAYITGQSVGQQSLQRAQVALAQEFASVADPRTGRGYYDGDSAGNSASIAAREVESALDQMRTQYQTGIDRGLTPDVAYCGLSARTQTETNGQASTQAISARSSGDRPLSQGDQGADITRLQLQLSRLGFCDAQSQGLAADGDFGNRTREAVQRFQHVNGLKMDGVAGLRTLDALKKGEQAPLLSSPSHPDHALYKQALSGVEQLPPGNFKSEQERQNAAASLAFDAKVSGLKQIDHVVLSTNGSSLFAVQGRMDDPAHNRVHVDKAQAAAQTIERSTQQLDQDVQQQQQQQNFPQQQAREPKVMMA